MQVRNTPEMSNEACLPCARHDPPSPPSLLTSCARLGARAGRTFQPLLRLVVER